MKKIFLFFITFLIGVHWVFAENKVDISLSKPEVNTWDIFNLSINISSDSQDIIELLEINWIEKFDIIWKQEGSQNINVNGNLTISHSLNLDLTNSNSGSYILWPVSVKFWEEIIHSDPLDIIVNEFIVPNLNDNNIVTQENTKELNKEDDINKKPVIKDNTSEINQEFNNDLTNQSNILLDIHPIKKLEITISSFKYVWLIYASVLILFIVIFYLFLIKILNNKKIWEINKQKELDNIENRKIEIKNIYNELLVLSDKAEKYSQEQFYTELNNLFRRFFLYIWINKADKKTLTELSKDNIDKKILDIFTMSYMYEFSTKVDSLAERKQIIMNFMIFLKK